MLKGETAEHELIFKKIERTSAIKSNTPQEYLAITSGYHNQIDSLVEKRIKDRLSQSGEISGGGNTGGGGVKINDNRKQIHHECKDFTFRRTYNVKQFSGKNILTRPWISIGKSYRRRIPSRNKKIPVAVEVVMKHTKILITAII